MLFKKTLLVLTCSTLLVACGGGSSSGDSSGGGSTDGGSGGVTTPVSDLDKAKQLISTTNAIISYYDGFQDIADNYKTPVEILNNTSSDLGRATEIVVLLSELALDDAKGQSKNYSSADLERLLKDASVENGFPIEYDLKNNTLQIQVTAGSVKVNGTADVAYWNDFKTTQGMDWGNPAWLLKKDNFIYANQATVKVSNVVVEAPFVANQNTYNFKIAQGGVIEVTNQAKQQAKFSFTANSTGQSVHPVSNTMENQGTLPQKATLQLQGLVFESAGVKASLNEVSTSAKTVKFSDGSTTGEKLIPYELVLKGQLSYLQETLDLDASFKLNNDLSKVIDLSTGKESALNFLNADLAVKLAGKLKGANAAPTPFSVAITAKRSEYTQGTANVAVSVDKNALDIALTAQGLDKEKPVIAGQVKHKNGAFVHIADVQNFSLADVKVGNTTYGTISKTSSDQYAVKFIDNSVVYIAP